MGAKLYDQYASQDYWDNYYKSLYNGDDTDYQEYYNELKNTYKLDERINDFNDWKSIEKDIDILSNLASGGTPKDADLAYIANRYGNKVVEGRDRRSNEKLLDNLSNQYKSYMWKYGTSPTMVWANSSVGDVTSKLQNDLTTYANQRKESDKAKKAAQKEVTDARESTIADREQSAKQAYTQARTQGLGRGLAASIGNAPLADNSASSYQSNYSALSNAQASSQNDYLNKLGYANAMQNQADNQSKGDVWNTIGAFIGGAGSGAQIGNSLFAFGNKGE